eukprot:TRINITY_DN2191_c0_g1_i2.p1 TRINITY_DN2191_c0_g1~~TRINITY_DN2191_c0_g1_i2.p1  ORF type:complete len:136 (-),score=3.87 TRINITY_DN2191_c0_g1_i2:105-512(-)
MTHLSRPFFFFPSGRQLQQLAGKENVVTEADPANGIKLSFIQKVQPTVTTIRQCFQEVNVESGRETVLSVCKEFQTLLDSFQAILFLRIRFLFHLTISKSDPLSSISVDFSSLLTYPVNCSSSMSAYSCLQNDKS